MDISIPAQAKYSGGAGEQRIMEILTRRDHF
jgi:hypothetical protein